MDETLISALDQARKKQGLETEAIINFKEGTLLQINFDEHGIDLEKYGVKSPTRPLSVKKLVFSVQICQVGKPAKQAYQRDFYAKELNSKSNILKNGEIFISNVSQGAEIKFNLMMVPMDSSSISSDPSQKKKEILRALGPSGSFYLNDYADKIKNNAQIQTTFLFCKNDLSVNFQIVQNALTKQPHRVIEVAFHRLIKLDEKTDFLPAQQDGSAAQDQPQKNRINLVMLERTCIEKLNEVVRAEDIE